jgi:hypothetical protein
MRLGLVPSALVVGSMTPDLPYYVPLPVDFDFTHTLAGVVSIDLAMGLIAFAVWQVLFAPVAVALAPQALRQRLAPRWPAPWRSHVAGTRPVALVVASLLLGALTHILWDAFTHEGRWGARHIDWLADRHGNLTGYRWAQYVSGLAGLVLIAWAAWRWWRAVPRADPDQAPQRIAALGPRAAWAVAGTVIGAVVAGGIAGFAVAAGRGEVLSRELYRAATWGGAAGLRVACVAAVACHRALARRAAS